MPRTYESTKRRVNTCTECQQRKQRCDRQLPCECCIRRGVPQKCLYKSHLSASARSSGRPGAGHLERQTWRQNSVDGSRSENGTLPMEQAEPDVSDLPAQIGYQLPWSGLQEPGAVKEIYLDSSIHCSYAPKSKVYPRRIGKEKWSKYCKITSTPLKQTVVQGLVDIFFAEANWYFTVLDRYYFDIAQRNWLNCHSSIRHHSRQGFSSDDLFLPALLYQVIAIGIHFLPTKSFLADEMIKSGTPPSDGLSQKLSDAGDAIVELIGRHNQSIIAVQADLMRCAWLKNSGRGAEAWHKLGSAIRQAQDIGLHQEPETPGMGQETAEYLRAAWFNEHKRRLWACLFTWESHMALQLGRTRAIHASDCTVAMPIDADMPQEPARTLFRPTEADARPSAVSSQVVKLILAQKIQSLMSSGALNHESEDYSLVQTTHQQVLDLLNALHPSLRAATPDESWDLVYPDVVKQRLQISIIANSFLLSLHRPHVKRHVESLDAAIDAATSVLHLSHTLFGNTPKHQHKTFTLIFYTIDAGILLTALTSSLSQQDSRRQHGRRCLKDAIDRLDVLKERNGAAEAGQKALITLLQKLSVKEETPGSQPNDASLPVTQAVRSEKHNHLETLANDQLDDSTVVASSVDTAQQNVSDGWDFLPVFNDPDDLLTAMVVDSGFTSGWLERSLEDMTFWNSTPTYTNDDWIISSS